MLIQKKFLNAFKHVVNWCVEAKNKYILLLASLLICAAALLFGFSNFLEDKTKTWMLELEVRDLSAQADTVAGFLDTLGVVPTPENLNPYIAKVGVTPNFRITVFDTTGSVLADSWLSLDEVKTLETRTDRPEISQSNLHTTGMAIRYSSTVGKELMFVTRRYQRDNFSGYIRIATPPALAADDLKELHQDLMEVVFIMLIVLFGIAVYVFKHMKHTQRLTQEQKVTLSCLDQQSQSMLLTQKFGQALTTCESRSELIQVISQMGSHLFGEDTVGALAVSPPSLDTIEIIATWGEAWPGEERYRPKDCWGFRRGGVHLSKSNGMEIKCNHVETDHYAIQCVPLQSQGISLGALHIGASPEVFDTASFQNKINTVSEQLCLTIANLNLRRKLEQLAIRDPLTTLYNRRYLDDSFTRELKRAERKKTSLGVIMVDIDHFKIFNDTYGHDAGDYVIKEFAKLLFDTVRGEDICCRYGGEEFALVLNEIDGDTVVKRSTELLQAVRALALKYNNQSLGQITISLGIAMFPQHGSTQQELIKAADDALYIAKKEGRNQLRVVGEGKALTKIGKKKAA